MLIGSYGLLCLLVFCIAVFSEAHKPRIAIVGGGIGGTSAAYFLKSLFGDNEVAVDIYERLHVGGRLATTQLDGKWFETGGSAIHPKNKYMTKFVKELGLTKRHVFGIRLGLYDGDQYLILNGNRPVSAFGQLFHRYGDSISDFHAVINDFFNRFLRIYDVQEKGFAFTNVKNLLEAVDPLMVNLTQVTARKYFLDKGLLHAFVNEICSGILRICFGQSPEVNGFVGVTSLAGAQAGLFGVLGGNDKIPGSLIEKSNSTLIWADVQRITLKADNTYEVYSVLKTNNDSSGLGNSQSSSSQQGSSKTYDLVVVTTPLMEGISNIKFSGFPAQIDYNKGHYHTSVITLVNGNINTKFFGTRHSEMQLDEILTIKENPLFKALIRVYPVDDDEEQMKTTKIWKILSERPLTEEELDSLFVERKSVTSSSWLGSPHYSPPEILDTFVLHPGLYYTSGIDWVASTIEMSAIAAKNVALLAYYHWRHQNSHVDSTPWVHNEL